MSTNIITTNMLNESTLHITAKELRQLYYEVQDDLVEGTFFDEIDLLQYDDDYVITIEKLTWYGVGSGRNLDVLQEQIIPALKGEAKVQFVWESGDLEEWHIKDGKWDFI